ncbi:MAG: hypothetical protein J6U54_14590 [Clostridiales bacterium]|nr:hypothetical protein [Clostridiales bacterium]
MSSIISNDPKSVKLRRNRNTLVVAGMGVVAFGIWSIIKTLMEGLFGSLVDEMKELLIEMPTAVKFFILCFTAIFMLIDVLLRILIGVLAYRNSKREKQSLSILIPAVMVGITSAFSLFVVVHSMLVENKFTVDNYVAFFVELTSFSILLELIIVTIDNKRITSRKNKKDKENAA